MMYGENTGAGSVVKRIPADSVGVEIGVWRGDTSAQFLKRARHLHLVDPWSVDAYSGSNEFGGYSAYLKRYKRLVGSDQPAEFRRFYDDLYASVVQRFTGLPVTIHRCTSAEFFAGFADAVDWVYVDGAHTFDGCLFDLRGAYGIADQFIFGDDYGNREEVVRAVDTFIAETGLPLETFGLNQYQITL